MTKEKRIILDYRRRYPDISFRKLASRIIEKENIKINSEFLRKKISNVLNYEVRQNYEAVSVDLNRQNQIEIPESFYEEKDFFYLPTKEQKILILSDIHVPFHSIEALKIACEYGKEQGISTIILNGDVIDCYGESTFVKDPNLRDFSKELNLTKTLLTNLVNYFGNIDYYYKFGNHEKRHERYIFENAEVS